jgi:hypothetical protein
LMPASGLTGLVLAASPGFAILNTLLAEAAAAREAAHTPRCRRGHHQAHGSPFWRALARQTWGDPP